MQIVLLVSLLTFLHYVAAQMRSPVLPLYAAAHGATATGVGLIIGAHMAVAAAGSIPLGRASDIWGSRPLLLGGMAVGVVTSLALPFVERDVALLVIYGLAGLGVAAFSPSALALVGDAAPPGRIGRAYAWYSTAHYGAIGIGPFLGGLAAEWWGMPAAFVISGAGLAMAFVFGLTVPVRRLPVSRPVVAAGVRRNASVWAAWIAAVSGLLVQGVLFTFFPLLGQKRGLTPAAIGLVFLVIGVANTLARFPAGWLVDHTGWRFPYAIGGVSLAAVVLVLLPHVQSEASQLALAAVFGGISGVAFVAISVALVAVTTTATRGLVMGGYSTSLYLGLALGSFGPGPVITHYGYAWGFAAGGGAGLVGALVSAALWIRSARIPITESRRSGTESTHA